MQSRSCLHSSMFVLLLFCLEFSSVTNVLGARIPLQQTLDDATWIEEALLQEQSALAGKRGEGGSSSGLASSSLWFGPRLGRRRRSPPETFDADYLFESDDGSVRAENLLGQFRDGPWTIIALREFPGGKRQTLTFTPRLGRELFDSSEVLLRSPPFSPRLGRGNGLPFSPRLGRQQIKDQQHQQVKTISSINEASMK